MTKEELTDWALRNGWQIIAGCPSLTKPSSPKEAIVRLVLKATVVNARGQEAGRQVGEGSGRELCQGTMAEEGERPLGWGSRRSRASRC